MKKPTFLVGTDLGLTQKSPCREDKGRRDYGPRIIVSPTPFLAKVLGADPWQVLWLTGPLGRITVAGQHRIRTGLPLLDPLRGHHGRWLFNLSGLYHWCDGVSSEGDESSQLC